MPGNPALATARAALEGRGPGGHSPSPHFDQGATAGEFCDAKITVYDIHVAGRVRRHSRGTNELQVPTTIGAPLGQIGSHAVELLNAVVLIIRDVHVSGGIGRHAKGIVEFSISATVHTPF